MNITKAFTGAALATGLTTLLAGGAMAQAGLTAVGSVTTQTTGNTVFTSAPGGDTLQVSYADGFFAPKVGAATPNTTVSFKATGGSTTDMGGGNFLESFTGGSFSVFNGATDLLSGTFSTSSFFGTVGAVSGGLNANGVTFDAASTALPAGFSLLNGSVSLTFNTINNGVGYTLTGGKLNDFTASDSGTYSARKLPAAVPEPATVVPFMLGGLGLLTLAVRKSRRSASVTA